MGSQLMIVGDINCLHLRFYFIFYSLAKGDPAAFLPIMSYAFTSYSTYVTEQLIASGVELAGKNDIRFLDAVYKVQFLFFCWRTNLNIQG